MSDNYCITMGESQYHKFKLIAFIIYNFVYVFYMLGHMPRVMYLALLMFFIIICVAEYADNKDYILFQEKDNFIEEYRRGMLIVLALLLISVFFQIIHREFGGYLVGSLLYVFLPPTMAFFWINTTEEDERFTYILVILGKNVLYFILANLGNFTLSNILKISWSDSKSSVFETPYAHDFFFLELIFLYFGNYKISFVCMLLCMLNFKRISFILSVLVFIGWMIMKKFPELDELIHSECEINVILRRVVLVVWCVIPIGVLFMVSDFGLELFRNTFGIELNDFTTGRTSIIRYVLENIGNFNGFGSSDHYLKTSDNEALRILGSMHCEVLSLYLETTVIGVFIYMYQMMEIVRKNLLIFFMMMYLILELIFSHFLNQLGVWSMFFMFMAMIYCENKKAEE